MRAVAQPSSKPNTTTELTPKSDSSVRILNWDPPPAWRQALAFWQTDGRSSTTFRSAGHFHRYLQHEALCFAAAHWRTLTSSTLTFNTHGLARSVLRRRSSTATFTTHGLGPHLLVPGARQSPSDDRSSAGLCRFALPDWDLRIRLPFRLEYALPVSLFSRWKN